MFSPLRIPKSKTPAREEKTSNKTKHDLRLTSSDLKTTSKDEDDKVGSKKVKSKEILRGGNPNDDNPIKGRNLIERSSDIGIVNLHSSKGTHWVLYVHEFFFDSYGCSSPQNFFKLL